MKFCLFIILLLLSLSAVPAIAATTLPYTYDANGNMISSEGKYYEYNDANQMVKIRHGDANGPVIAEFVYDHTGQRVKKIENGVNTYYIGKHYEMQKDSSGQSTNKYYFANGERVARKDSTGKLTFFYSDHLGGTNVLADAGGNLIERTKFYPFGEIREGGGERYLYTGKEKDGLTDWYYYEARYKSPHAKQFTTADSLVSNLLDPQSINRYSYARNNPIRYIDPDGHEYRYIDKNGINSDNDNIGFNKYKNELLKSNKGKELLGKLDSLSNKYEIYLQFDNLKDSKGNSLRGASVMSKEGVVLIRLDNNLKSKNVAWGATTLAHEIRHVFDWVDHYEAGQSYTAYQPGDGELYTKQEQPAYEAQNEAYKDLKSDMSLSERSGYWFQWAFRLTK